MSDVYAKHKLIVPFASSHMRLIGFRCQTDLLKMWLVDVGRVEDDDEYIIACSPNHECC
jgi:hypothetical protein